MSFQLQMLCSLKCDVKSFMNFEL